MREGGTDVEIYWVPGHKCVEENEKSDDVAKGVIEKAGK